MILALPDGKDLMARMSWAAVAVVLGFTTSAGAADELTVLSDFELDAITAAGVLVDVSSVAAALGEFAHTQTDANTFAFVGEHLELGVGTTIGEALACCGEKADVEVGSTVFGIGDIVHGAAQRIDYDGRPLDYGLSVGFIVAISFRQHLVALRAEHQTMLEELRAALADFHFELSDAVMVGAQ